MCGIFASVGFTPDRECINIVKHRGPDGEGWEVFDTKCGPLALGHRRLAIIDLTDAGHQPMSYEDGQYWLVFNGEIYNYLELRRELELLGRVFRTHTDSEVLLAAYAQWGELALDRFLGMFAFLIWDTQKQVLFAARDRFGIKPLYWTKNSTGIAFASEIKQLLNLSAVSRRMNVARVFDFLEAGISEHTGQTMFADVYQLRGGECATLDISAGRLGGTPKVRRWYDILKSGGLELSEENAGDQFRELLTNSVSMHLRSDVPIGSCLSGGLDSSSIVCLMDRLLGQGRSDVRINTVSACYLEKEVDERPFMDFVVEFARCDPHYVYPSVDEALARAEDITWHQDEPYGSTSIFAQWKVFATAREAGVKVMLDGQGADEQLAGYHGGFHYYTADLVRRRKWITLIRTILQRKEYHDLSYLDQVRRLAVPYLPTRIVNRGKSLLRAPDWLNFPAFKSLSNTSGAFDTAVSELGMKAVRTIGDLCVALTQGSNLTMLLHWEDRNSMAHGIEARVPFLDHRLVEFSLALGDLHKTVLADTKRVLRRAMRNTLPQKVLDRRDKLGFATPEEKWLRGNLRSAVEAGVEETLARFPGLLNVENTRLFVRQMLDGKLPWNFSVWRIVNVGIWGRVFNVGL